MSKYVNIPPISGSTTGWAGERLAVALDRVPTLNRYYSSDLIAGDYETTGAGTPVRDTTRSCGVWTLPSIANDSSVYLGSTSETLIALPKAESWYVAARILIPDTFSVTAGHYQIPIGLVQAGGHATYVSGVGDVSTTIFQLEYYAPAVNRVSMGSVGTLGSATCPLDTFFTVALMMDSTTGTISVEFSDTVAYSSTTLTNMSAASAKVASLANVVLQPMSVDALFWAGVAPTS